MFNFDFELHRFPSFIRSLNISKDGQVEGGEDYWDMEGRGNLTQTDLINYAIKHWVIELMTQSAFQCCYKTKNLFHFCTTSNSLAIDKHCGQISCFLDSGRIMIINDL